VNAFAIFLIVLVLVLPLVVLFTMIARKEGVLTSLSIPFVMVFMAFAWPLVVLYRAMQDRREGSRVIQTADMRWRRRRESSFLPVGAKLDWLKRPEWIVTDIDEGFAYGGFQSEAEARAWADWYMQEIRAHTVAFGLLSYRPDEYARD
jgi:hypothetical protein